jgi:hypothetical protein
MKNFTDSDKQEIITRILTEVENQGSARVGFHATEVLNRDEPVPYNIKSKIEATIISSRQYISRPHPNFRNDFEILKNPNYNEERQNLELQQLRSQNMLLVEQVSDYRRMKMQRKIAIIISVVSIITTIVVAISKKG